MRLVLSVAVPMAVQVLSPVKFIIKSVNPVATVYDALQTMLDSKLQYVRRLQSIVLGGALLVLEQRQMVGLYNPG